MISIYFVLKTGLGRKIFNLDSELDSWYVASWGHITVIVVMTVFIIGLASALRLTYLHISSLVVPGLVPGLVPARENIFLFPDTIILTRETEGQIDRGPPYGINPPPFLLQTSHSNKTGYQTQQTPGSKHPSRWPKKLEIFINLNSSSSTYSCDKNKTDKHFSGSEECRSDQRQLVACKQLKLGSDCQ